MDLSKHTFLFLFSLIFLVGTVVAQPPQANIDLSANQLEISYPKYETVPFNKGYNLSIHVFNGTNISEIKDADCDLELYNQNGDHLVNNLMLNLIGDEYNTYLQPGNFTLGIFQFNIYCNNSGGSGFVDGTYTITADGNPYRDFPVQFSIILFSFLIIFVSYFNERLSLFRYVGSMLMMTMGIVTLYPGYNFINYSTLTGMSLGLILIAAGFYFLIEDAFGRPEKKNEEEEKPFSQEDEDEY